MKRLLVLALSLALGLTATACTDSTGPGAAVAGTYTLRSIGSQTPPVSVNGFLIVAGRIVLDANGNYSGFTTEQFSNGSQVEYRIDGYWTVSGDQIALTDQLDPNFPYIGIISNSTITILSNNSTSGYDEVYSK